MKSDTLLLYKLDVDDKEVTNGLFRFSKSVSAEGELLSADTGATVATVSRNYADQGRRTGGRSWWQASILG